MDTSLLLDMTSKTEIFFEKYLNKNIGNLERSIVLFYDDNLPDWFIEGLKRNTKKLIQINCKRVTSQKEIIDELWQVKTNYITVLDFVAYSFFPSDKSAVKFCEIAKRIDYTSFEFPRYDINNEKIEHLLTTWIEGDPDEQLEICDTFYGLLSKRIPYKIEFYTGKDQKYKMTVTGGDPWMELAGPLCEGNMRFAPGSEVFYHGQEVNGVLECREGINLLPLRNKSVDKPMCEALLSFARLLKNDPVQLIIEKGQIIDVVSEGSSSKTYKKLIEKESSFKEIVEVGIGFNYNSLPIINTWLDSSNEAAPGFHLGVGADPSNTSRFNTCIHMDFMCPDSRIIINDELFFDGEKYLV